MNEELWHAFDRIKAGLDKQERLRATPGFGEWCVRALPQFSTYLDLVDTWDDERPGDLLCEWLDWLDTRGLAWRGNLRWKMPTAGPLSFYPPTMAMVMQIAGEEVRKQGLSAALSRLVASLEASTRVTPGEGGRKGGKKLARKK